MECRFPGCKKDAIFLAAGILNNQPKFYCEEHAVAIADEGNPEYIVDCPNCGCKFGVN